VPGVYDDVEALTETEAASYTSIDFNLETYKTEVRPPRLGYPPQSLARFPVSCA